MLNVCTQANPENVNTRECSFSVLFCIQLKNDGACSGVQFDERFLYRFFASVKGTENPLVPGSLLAFKALFDGLFLLVRFRASVLVAT